MERKRSTKSIRRLSLKKTRPSTMSMAKMPSPNIEFEDVLVSQLQVSDVINNSVLEDSSSMLSLNSDPLASPVFRRQHSCLYHRCYHNTTLVPLWQAFASLDGRASGKVLLGRLMHMSSALSGILGVDKHNDKAVQQQFVKYSHVSFSTYKRYVMDTTAGMYMDPESLSAHCWSICKDRFLNNPLVDNLDSVVPPELAEAIYWLFCVFNNLSEPDTYPPSMDYEEADLLLRKLFAALGLPWSSHEPDNGLYDDSSSDTNSSSFEPSTPPKVTFQHLLSVIADLVGTDLARSHTFYKAIQRICLSEYLEVMKAGWLMARKADSDVWKKRWAVLQGSRVTLYSSQACLDVKEQFHLHNNMHIESLPGVSQHKHRFRIVEKEGDYSITSEREFSSTNQKQALSWLTLFNVAIKVTETGMSAKTSEISERRLERYQRRESEREVFRKKREVLETYERLQEAKKARSEVEEALALRAQQREARMIHLLKLDKIYERLESIQYQESLCHKAERERNLLRMLSNFERMSSNQNAEETPKEPISHHALSQQHMLNRLAAEREQLEEALEELRLEPNHLSVSMPRKPSLQLQRPAESLPGDLCYDYRSSSENMSTTSTDLSHLTLPDVTSHYT